MTDADSPSALRKPGPGLFARRPSVPAVILIILGICLAFELPVRPWAYLGVSALAAVAATIFRRYAGASSALIALGLVSIGAVAGQCGFFRYAGDDIGAFSSAQPRLTQVEFRIDGAPRLSSGSSGGRTSPPKQMLAGTLEKILTRDGWASASGSILVQVAHPDAMLADGQEVRVLGMLQRPAHATNPGEFDWADYYRDQRALSSIRVSRVSNIQVLSDRGAGPRGWLRERARDLLAMGFTDKHAGDHAMLRALVLGDNDPMMRESQTQLQKIGVAYLLSISGMHIAIVAACVYWLCRLLMRSPRFACWACLVVIGLYALMALPGEAGLRAVLLSGAVVLGILFRRDIDKLQLLAIVAGVLLLLNPMELFSAGFELGFVCITGLILLGGPLLRWMWKRDRRHDGLMTKRSLFRRAGFGLRAWVAISLVAWIISMPLVAYHFGQLSPWAIPCGVVLFPVVAVALVMGCGKILLTLLWPSLAGGWAAAAGMPIMLLRKLAAVFAHLPAASITATRPSILVILLYYALLSLAIFPWPGRWFRRGSIGLAAAAACCLVGSFSLGFPLLPSSRGDDGISITFLDIGAGQCAVLEAPGSAPVMMDAGSSTISDVTRTCLAPYLNERGDRTIGAVMLSHSDYDHISAISTALPVFGVGVVYTSSYFAHFASIDPPAQALLDQLNRAGRSPHLIGRGDRVQLGPGVSVDVLWPPADCAFNCNNTGLVVKLSYAGKTVLFPADIQADAMRELLKSPAQLKADVLVAAHHGSSEKTTPAFVRAVNPQFIISSNGSPLTEKQKLFELMIGKRPLYRTSNCGAITLRIGRDGTLSVRSFIPQSLAATTTARH
jgi:competence protein ComEC